ncbi:PRD domain-containing protein [Corynebacterium nasicanis]|uniref:PRD domain-containing protein n=1 Tax=Corynebacterium nasicanis TaxID=1448267 RepID=A0ABW1QGS5_9CORY
MADATDAAPRIIRVFSNNAVLVRLPGGDEGEELVMVGRGIGFQRKQGDEISAANADHQYMELSPDKVQFLRSVNAIDPEIMETISAAVDLAVDLLGELHPSVYAVLAEHISFAVQRVGLGETIRNSLLDEIRASFPLEFRAAELVVGYLNSHVDGIDLPVDEAAYIALHLNAARLGVTVKQPLATAHALAGLIRLVCLRLNATTTALDGTPDRTLAIELTRLSRRAAAAQFRTNLLRRSVERDLPREIDLARQVLCRILDVPSLPSHVEGEAAFLAVFLHGWQQTVRPN